ncbi:hypothetical protein GCM10010254_24120 [Streptomyces chromofuscus]|nr:hypothetical protein GCM10010254_24120 [Streptomyces chromofuscus]
MTAAAVLRCSSTVAVLGSAFPRFGVLRFGHESGSGNDANGTRRKEYDDSVRALDDITEVFAWGEDSRLAANRRLGVSCGDNPPPHDAAPHTNGAGVGRPRPRSAPPQGATQGGLGLRRHPWWCPRCPPPRAPFISMIIW